MANVVLRPMGYQTLPTTRQTPDPLLPGSDPSAPLTPAQWGAGYVHTLGRALVITTSLVGEEKLQNQIHSNISPLLI